MAIGLLFLLGIVLVIGWRLWRTLGRTDDPAKLAMKWLVTAAAVFVLYHVLPWGIPGLLVGLVLGIFLSILWAPHIGALVSQPITAIYDGGDQESDARPLYSIAEAKRKQGKYAEAMAEVRAQLEKFPDDFTGWLLLAEIQAEKLNDLAGAQDTIDRILSQKGHLPKNVAYALSRLADWHLKFGLDRESARTALERIVQLLPDTEQAQLALQRIAHLAPQEIMTEQSEPRRFHLKHQEENLGLRDSGPQQNPSAVDDPVRAAAALVKHLEQHPHDAEAREQLALIYADHYKRLDLAGGQLEQLISTPHQSAKQIVHWLNLLADVQIRTTGDGDLARKTLRRIVEQFPKTAAATNASNRLARLNLELRPHKKSQAVKLGSYEQNLGLKGDNPNADPGRSASRSR